MSMLVGRFVCLSADAYGGQKEDTRCPRVGVTDSCELPDLGAESSTQVLWKRNQFS